jgi:two-component system nitrate/nitrite response regulator NarL
VSLSPQETKILRSLASGLSNKQIARELGLAEATVKVHLRHASRKVRATNRTQAAIWAVSHGLPDRADGLTLGQRQMA